MRLELAKIRKELEDGLNQHMNKDFKKGYNSAIFSFNYKIENMLIDLGFMSDNNDIEQKLFKFIQFNFGISEQEMKSKTRNMYIVWARTLFYHVLRLNGASYHVLGRKLNQDHSTVIAMLKNVPLASGWRKEQLIKINKHFNC